MYVSRRGLLPINSVWIWRKMSIFENIQNQAPIVWKMNNAITRINRYPRKTNSSLPKRVSLGPKLSTRAFMGSFWGDKSSSHLGFWRDMQVAVCLCAQITSGTPLVWHFIEYQRQDVSCENMYVCFGTLIWSWTPIAHRFAFSWFFSKQNRPRHIFLQLHIFMFSIPPSVLLFWAVLSPLEHSASLSTKFVYIRVPQINS